MAGSVSCCGVGCMTALTDPRLTAFWTFSAEERSGNWTDAKAQCTALWARNPACRRMSIKTSIGKAANENSNTTHKKLRYLRDRIILDNELSIFAQIVKYFRDCCFCSYASCNANPFSIVWSYHDTAIYAKEKRVFHLISCRSLCPLSIYNLTTPLISPLNIETLNALL